MPYAKLETSILTSTVWAEPHPTRIVWITMLALADRDGYVASSVPGLAHLARVTREEAETAIATLSAPDLDSRTKTLEGRRIVAVNGGWTIVNYKAVRDNWSADERRDYQRRWVKNKRMSTGSVDTCRHVDKVEAPTPAPTPTPTPKNKSLAAKAASEPVPAKRDEIWDAVLTVCGIDPEAKLTKNERGKINVAVKQLKDAGATPTLIEGRAMAYRRKWPRAELTPLALASNWNQVIA